MFCSHCGTQLPDASAFCHSCGARVVAPSDAEPSAAPASQPKQLRPARAPASPVPLLVGAMVLFVAIVVIVVLVAMASGGDSENSDEGQVRAILLEEIDRIVARDPEGLYELYSSEGRSLCSISDIESALGSGSAFVDFSDVSIKDVRVSVEGDIAYASYDVYQNDEFILHREADRVVKEDGRWYDAPDYEPSLDLC